MSGAHAPLAGVRVIELSHMVMGPSCGQILADLGAEVIKIEPRGRGDKTRYLSGSGLGLFPPFNRGKKSIQADLGDAEDLAGVRRLIAESDVLIENFRSGKLDALGLGWDELRKLNPGIICCSLKGFLAGPYGGRTALDEVVQMLGGLAYMTGPPGQPLRAGASVNDIMGGMFGAIGILAALRQRETTGTGTHITSALFENSVFLVGTHMAQGQITGQSVEPMPARQAAWSVYDIFTSGDEQQVFVSAVSDTQWRALCEAFGLDALAADRSLDASSERIARRPEILSALQSRLSALNLAEIEQICDDAGLPYARVNEPTDLVDDPHLVQSRALAEVRTDSGVDVAVPLLPFDFNGEKFGHGTDLPRVGQHAAEFADFVRVDTEDSADNS